MPTLFTRAADLRVAARGQASPEECQACRAAPRKIFPVRLIRALLPTPIGEMLALSSDDGLCALEFVAVVDRDGYSGAPRLSRLDARLKRHFPPHTIADGDSPVIGQTREWLCRYFEGAQNFEDIRTRELPLDMHGAPFEKRVWRELLRIAPGETTSYGAIARTLGTAAASRAVGAANGANPIAIIVPCHRVIGASGQLTGYGGGLNRKTWLLDHERRWRADALF